MILPTRIGQVVTFAALGRKFEVKRLNRSTWHLRDLSVSLRSRFGTKAEIAEDVAHVLECGVLPGGDKGRW